MTNNSLKQCLSNIAFNSISMGIFLRFRHRIFLKNVLTFLYRVFKIPFHHFVLHCYHTNTRTKSSAVDFIL